MAEHISRMYLCPDCDCIGANANQCAKCANRCGLLNLSSVLNRKKPVMADTVAILAMMREVGRERLA